MYHISFIHSPVAGHLRCLQLLAIVNSAAMNIGMHVSFRISVFSGYMPRIWIAGSCSNFSFSFLSTLRTVFQSGCTNLHSRVWCYFFFFTKVKKVLSFVLFLLGFGTCGTVYLKVREDNVTGANTLDLGVWETSRKMPSSPLITSVTSANVYNVPEPHSSPLRWR